MATFNRVTRVVALAAAVGYELVALVALIAGSSPRSLLLATPCMGAGIVFISTLTSSSSETGMLVLMRRVSWVVMLLSVVPLISFSFLVLPLVVAMMPVLWRRSVHASEPG